VPQPLPLTELAELPAPYLKGPIDIDPQWIDYNGHLNMAYYNVIFDQSADRLYAAVGLGRHYMQTRKTSTMTAECHVRYIREVHLGQPLQVSTLIVGLDEKRLHTFKELRHATEGWLSATSENMTLHVDMSTRKVAPFAPDIFERLRTVAAVHAKISKPNGLGRNVSMAART
jgi:acyl-CoA thioester hydrolase